MYAEADICRYLNTEHAIVMTSGHAVLLSALIAAGIGPGEQVIVPAYTYIASAMAVVGAGAIPVIAEVDESLTLDPADFEKKITPYTKAIKPVQRKNSYRYNNVKRLAQFSWLRRRFIVQNVEKKKALLLLLTFRYI